MMNETERRIRLIEWLEFIFKDVQDLLLDNYIFWELQKIIEGNSQFKRAPALFNQWLTSSFVQATVVGVRRQIKVDGDSISLKCFLYEVYQHPYLISRNHYMNLYSNKSALPSEVGNREFDKLAGQGGAYLPVNTVQQQLDRLISTTKQIEHYVDRRIVHYDKRGLNNQVPKFNDLDNSLKVLEELVKFYWRWLKGDSMTQICPEVQYDWKAIFRFPWLEIGHK